MRYLKGTLDYGLRYVIDHEFGLHGYSDGYANILVAIGLLHHASPHRHELLEGFACCHVNIPN
jgi:hypothetical protein